MNKVTYFFHLIFIQLIDQIQKLWEVELSNE